MRILLAIIAALFGSGCTLDPLPRSWELDRIRVLGVRATPAEPQPGELTIFESLIYLPEGTELDSTLWFACLPEAGEEFGCTLDSAALEALEEVESGELSEEELFELLLEAGMIGADPFWPASWTPPEDALDELSPDEQLEGLSAMINLTVIPEGADPEEDQEIAFKRVPVSMATHPNHNPEIIGTEVDGEPYPPGATLEAVRGRTYEIAPILSDSSIEIYTYVDSQGVCEERIEEPYFNWYIEGGSVDMPFSLYPFSSIEWTAPEQAFDGMIVATARDRRGGMAWVHLAVTVP